MESPPVKRHRMAGALRSNSEDMWPYQLPGCIQRTGSRQGDQLIPVGLRFPRFKTESLASWKIPVSGQTRKMSHASLRIRSLTTCPPPAQSEKQQYQVLTLQPRLASRPSLPGNGEKATACTVVLPDPHTYRPS